MSKDLRNTIIAAVLFLLFAAAIVYDCTTKQEEIDVVTAANTSLENEIQGYEQEIAKGPGLKRKLDELQTNFRDYVKILPSAEVATEERLLKVVQAYCDAAQIRLEEVLTSTGKGGGGGAKLGEFKDVGVSFRIQADFDSFIRFLNLLERHEQFIKVNSFAVTPSRQVRIVENKEVIDLGVSIQITTCTYVPKK